jgi:DNA-binding MarR family transcriptional regulator
MDKRALYFARSRHYGGKVARALTTADKSYGWLDIQWATQFHGKNLYTLEAIIANGINALDTQHNGWVIVSRKEEDYQRSPIYGDLSYNTLTKLLDALQAKAFIEQIIGEKDIINNIGKRTEYRLTPTFIDLITQQLGQDPQELPQVNEKVGKSYTAIENKSGKKRILITKLNEEETKQLKLINEAAQQHKWEGLPTPQYWKVNKLDKSKTEVGGRIYCDAQWQPKENRQDWKVDGKEMKEIDIQASQIQILYAFASKAKNR